MDQGDDGEEAKGARSGTTGTYGIPARDPQHARATTVHLYELDLLRHHVHPLVAEGAAAISARRKHQRVEQPLTELSTSSLLDQLAYVQPKKKDEEQSKKLHAKMHRARKAPVNTNRFLERKNVAPHEYFFRHYFEDAEVQKQRDQRIARKKKDKAGADEADVDDLGEADDDDDDIDKYFDEQAAKELAKDGVDFDADDDDDDLDIDEDLVDDDDDMDEDDG